MSDLAVDRLPPELMERAEGRHDGTVYWPLGYAAQVLSACRERQLLPAMVAIVAVRDDEILEIDAPGPWGFSHEASWDVRPWRVRVERSVAEAEELVARADSLARDRPDLAFAFVLRPWTEAHGAFPVLGMLCAPMLIVGPLLVYGVCHLFPNAVRRTVLDSPLTVITAWCIGCAVIALGAFVADRIAVHRRRSGAANGDGPLRAREGDARRPQLVAHVAILALVLWVWSPMGAALLYVIQSR